MLSPRLVGALVGAPVALLLAACSGSTTPQAQPSANPDPSEPGTQATRPLSKEGQPASLPPPSPRFEHAQEVLTPQRRSAMVAANVWRRGCPVALEDLVVLRLSHWDFDGNVAQGELVVKASVAPSVVEAFQVLFERRFPIEQMRPIEAYAGSDDASMAANNTSAFNCRQKTGKNEFSRHSYGTAIDINPIQNPYVKGPRVLPAAGARFIERTGDVKGLIVRGPVTEAFTSRGWEWGGDWNTLKDYQHFETP